MSAVITWCFMMTTSNYLTTTAPDNLAEVLLGHSPALVWANLQSDDVGMNQLNLAQKGSRWVEENNTKDVDLQSRLVVNHLSFTAWCSLISASERTLWFLSVRSTFLPHIQNTNVKQGSRLKNACKREAGGTATVCRHQCVKSTQLLNTHYNCIGPVAKYKAHLFMLSCLWNT